MKEVVLGRPSGNKMLRYPKESDVKAVPSRMEKHPVRFRLSEPEDSGASVVKNSLTLNINVGPDSLLHVTQGGDDENEENEKELDKKTKNIRLNFVANDKSRRKSVAAAADKKDDVEKKHDVKIFNKLENEDDDADDDDEEEESANKMDKTPVRNFE